MFNLPTNLMLSASHFDARGKNFLRFSPINLKWEIRVFYYVIYGSKTTKHLYTNVTRKFSNLPRSCLKWKLQLFPFSEGGFQGPLKIKRHFYCCFFDDRAFVSSLKPGVDTKKSLQHTQSALHSTVRSVSENLISKCNKLASENAIKHQTEMIQ